MAVDPAGQLKRQNFEEYDSDFVHTSSSSEEEKQKRRKKRGEEKKPNPWIDAFVGLGTMISQVIACVHQPAVVTTKLAVLARKVKPKLTGEVEQKLDQLNDNVNAIVAMFMELFGRHVSVSKAGLTPSRKRSSHFAWTVCGGTVYEKMRKFFKRNIAQKVT